MESFGFLWVCLGGGLGSGARYLVGLLAVRVLGSGFPFGTMVANLLGSLMLGLLLTLWVDGDTVHPGLKLALTTGFMGGFTTYSTYNYEVLRYLQRGAFGSAAAYLAVTVLGCLAFGYGGMLLAKG